MREQVADTRPSSDVLLDVMGTKPGRVQIEESGLPVVTLLARQRVGGFQPDEERPLEDASASCQTGSTYASRRGGPATRG